MKNILLLLFVALLLTIQTNGQTNWVKEPNPILLPGSAGEWDSQVFTGPFVIFDGSEYHMWYGGSDGVTGTYIGYANSLDGISWTKYDDPSTTNPPFAESDPVLMPGPSGSWDGITVFQPCVFFDGAMYHMWFGGHNGINNRRIGYATSPNPFDWEKHPDNPILNPGTGTWDDVWVDSPEVLFKDGIFHMWYSGSDGTYIQVGYATSPDGKVWTKEQTDPVLKVGSPGSWDDIQAYQPSVIFDGGTYHMWYSGAAEMGFVWEIGYAYSFDRIIWMKYDDPLTTDQLYAESDPVLIKGSAGSWDQQYVGLCSVILYNNHTAKMWYAGGHASLMGEIGYALDENFVVSVDNDNLDITPLDFSLLQNYPNPFNPGTTIKFTITDLQFISLKVYDVLGNEVANLVNKVKPAGSYEIEFNAAELPSGVYFYQLKNGSYAETKKMILLR